MALELASLASLERLSSGMHMVAISPIGSPQAPPFGTLSPDGIAGGALGAVAAGVRLLQGLLLLQKGTGCPRLGRKAAA